MYLTSLIHRDRLFDVASRWFADRVERGDGKFITEVFIYESLISGPTSRRFLTDIIERTWGEPSTLQRIFLKDDLRRAIIEGCKNPTEREQALFRQFRELPEEYFPRTPVDLILASGRDGTLLGMSRIKRIRRVAEKASRRIADRLAGAIQRHARSLAEIRARAMQVPLEDLVTPPETMAEEFATAERIVSQAFRDQELRFEPEDLRIDDVIGFKFVGEPERLARIEEAIRTYPGARVLEREEHHGLYNDINLIVDLDLPPVGEIADRMRGRSWAFAARRGLSEEVLARDFPFYVESGARSFRAEVILTTYDELVESEFGRSIHEERILEQRHSAPYSGRIATNASYIVEYLLMLAISPQVEVTELPVKMWGRYLPDTVSVAVWRLFGIERGGVLCDSFALDPNEVLAAPAEGC